MKNTIKLLFLGLLLFGITATRAQISTSNGGAANVLPNAPTTNTNVGIGTTNPTGKLDVMGPYAVVSLDPNSPATVNFRTSGSVQLAITTSSTPPYLTALQSKHSTIAGNAYPIALNPLGGNVGIGTATPSAKLDVNGNIAVGGLSAGSDASPLSKKIAAYNYQSIEAGAIDFLDFNTNRHATSIAFRAKNATNVPQEFMRIVGQDGNVGIGTTNPAGKLDVNGAVFLKGKPILDTDGTSSYFNSSAASYFQNMGSVSATITSSGYFGIGTTAPDERLTVKGKIHAQEVRVDIQGACIPDYVFQKYYTGKSELKSDYSMPTLAEIETFTKKNHHLPNVPSAKEIQQNGLSLGEMSNVLLQKIEELTLYAIEQDKKVSLQQQELDHLKTENENYKSLAERLSVIEKEFKK